MAISRAGTEEQVRAEIVDVALADRLDGFVLRAQAAADSFRQLDQRQVDEIVWAMVVAGLESAFELAQLAMEELRTGAAATGIWNASAVTA
jgi:acyl-CoA reductase-like NAD-dependent aldehyde dehydrogenase